MKKKRRHYLNNAELLRQLDESHMIDKVTEELGRSFLELVRRFQSKASWYNYPKQVKDELISNALCDLIEAWKKFDKTKSQNPFSYFTSVTANSFRKTMNSEKKYMNFKTFMFQVKTQQSIASYAYHMSKHDGIHKYIGKPAGEENNEKE